MVLYSAGQCGFSVCMSLEQREVDALYRCLVFSFVEADPSHNPVVAYNIGPSVLSDNSTPYSMLIK